MGFEEDEDRRDFPRRLRCLEQSPRRCDSFEQPSFEQSRRHCFPLNFFRIPFGVETTSPFLYLCGVAGRDLGDVGIERGRPSIAVGSMLDVLARDCDVLDRFKRAL